MGFEVENSDCRCIVENLNSSGIEMQWVTCRLYKSDRNITKQSTEQITPALTNGEKHKHKLFHK